MSDIDDSSKPADATVIKPRPGGRGAAPRLPRPAQPTPYREPALAALRDALGSGLNPLVRAATPLLLLSGHLRGVGSAIDATTLRRQALDEVRRFEDAAKSAGIHPDVVRAARYVLCASVDEAVLSTPWGAESAWTQQTLLVELHREAWGGEKFFEMLERASKEPARHIDFMELQYLCLVLGFAGKYNASDGGRSALTDIQHETYRLIRRERQLEKPELSLRWRGLEDRRNPVIRYVPWWVVGAAALSLVAITFAVLAARLRSDAQPVVEALSRVADIGLTAAPALPAAGPTIKQLLAAEEKSGVLQVEERGAQSFVTPQADDLFASGSATVNPQFEPTLRRIAEAINQVPGRVVVTGHTDDQPVRSARFGDNFELSRERAVSVARILQQSVTNPGRIMWNGVGPSRPKYTPASDPQNRARNRRVEIIHVREN